MTVMMCVHRAREKQIKYLLKEWHSSPFDCLKVMMNCKLSNEGQQLSIAVMAESV